MIDNLCLFHHISPEPAGVFPSRLSAPSYPLSLLPSSSPKDLNYHDSWWHADGTIWHILHGRLGLGPDALVPPWRDAQGFLHTTSRDLFAILLKNFGGGNHGSASLIKQWIRTLVCSLGKDAVTTYLTAW